MLNGIMLNVIMLNVNMLIAIRLNAVAPKFSSFNCIKYFCSTLMLLFHNKDKSVACFCRQVAAGICCANILLFEQKN
jgi:hypothetical protein